MIGTAINDWRPTPAFLALPVEERERIFKDRGYPHSYPQYAQAQDALMIAAQTKDRVCLFRQRIWKRLLVGDPEVLFCPQNEFTGRLKMYGRAVPEEYRNLARRWIYENVPCQ